jgi:RNA 2',3'-cyclic 3'-phosphodiesterase
MRLFLAIELDGAAQHAILAEQDRLKDAVDGSNRSSLRWVKPEHIHLTLVFLGEVRQDDGENVIQVMSEAIQHDRFAVAFGGLGIFPPRGLPKVLWLGLQRGSREVVAVQHQILERLGGLDVVAHERDRTFRPHLTLARWRWSTAADRRIVLGLSKPEAVAQLEVTHVTLVQSRLSSSGPSYTALCRTALAATGARPLQSEP